MRTFGVPLGAPVSPPGARPPDGRTLEGRFVRLEKLRADRHADALWRVARADPADRWAYLGDTGPFDDDGLEASFRDLIAAHEASADPFFYAVVPDIGEAAGFLSLMRHDTANGVIETGWIWLAEPLAGTAASTEAHFLLMRHAFDDLRMRRYEWKCNALNQPSRRAAERLGFTFEGIFRQVQIARGRNRDTAWYSVLDGEWPGLRDGFERWLSPVNFDAAGQQRQSLSSLRRAA